MNDKNPKSDKITELLFIQIKQSLKRDLKKYEQFIDKQRGNGALGGRPKKNPLEPKKPKPFLENPLEPKKADSVSDSVSDSVNENENKDIILNSESWITQIAIIKEKDIAEIKTYLNTFLDDLELKGEMDKPEKDIKIHFINWLNIELKKDKPKEETGRVTLNMNLAD